ncbi:lysozyme [Citrobacter amalonaticus]|nr:lysozyme [Citrobacter amalonaticus]
MQISSNGIMIIKKFEGFSPTAYPDAGGGWAIGYGHTGTIDGLPLTGNMRITEQKAEYLLYQDLVIVQGVIQSNVKIQLSQNQFDALCSLVFNIGSGAFMRSTLLIHLNRYNIQEAANEFLLWSNVGRKKGLLLPRRKKERQLFLSN